MKVYGVAGWKNAGKTGLMERLVAEITARGFSVSTVKHAHHSFDVDQPGTDSFRHRDAGASQVLLASANPCTVLTKMGKNTMTTTTAAFDCQSNPNQLTRIGAMPTIGSAATKFPMGNRPAVKKRERSIAMAVANAATQPMT